MMLRRRFAAWFLLFLVGGSATMLVAAPSWPAKGEYSFDEWAGPALDVHFSVPQGSTADTPILIVVPGARRNSDIYRDEWHALAVKHKFIVLAIGGNRKKFPTEWEYNLGGVISSEGWLLPQEKWLFSAIEPLFDDFASRYESNRKTYSIYGHSAGGGFVHRFVLFQPKARFTVAVAANPAFCTLPDFQDSYPFGVQGAPVTAESLAAWMNQPMVLMLGDQDRGPRTKPLSNSERARRQGPSVFARGLKLFQSAVVETTDRELPHRWRLDVVAEVGHSNAMMAPHAVKHLFPDSVPDTNTTASEAMESSTGASNR